MSNWVEVLSKLREERKSERGHVPRWKTEAEAAASSLWSCQSGARFTFGSRKFGLLWGWPGRFYCFFSFFGIFLFWMSLFSIIGDIF